MTKIEKFMFGKEGLAHGLISLEKREKEWIVEIESVYGDRRKFLFLDVVMEHEDLEDLEEEELNSISLPIIGIDSFFIAGNRWRFVLTTGAEWIFSSKYPILVEDSSDDETIEIISKMLPNREKVRFFIWDNLEPPISSKVDLFLRENIDSYGTWKEIYRANGNLAYRGWLYRQQKQGHWVYFYKDGRPHKDCYYRNNKFHAKCTFWKENGDYEIVEYYKGKCNGYKLRYRKDGLLYKELYSMKDESNL